MTNIKIFIALMTIVFAAASCSPEKKTLAEVSTAPEDDAGFAALDSSLYLQIGTRWEMDGDGAYALTDTCEIPRLAAVPTTKTCTFTIPEEKLYYSNLKFFVGTAISAACPIIHFQPYYYRRSNIATFKPAGQTTVIDCDPATATSDNPLCYGGAAPTMQEGFPENTGSYFNTNLIGSTTYDLPAENTTRWYGGLSVNYLVTNNITNAASTQAGSGPTARTGAWTDYSVSCHNIWGEMQYQINFVIEDENFDSNGGTDQWADWP